MSQFTLESYRSMDRWEREALRGRIKSCPKCGDADYIGLFTGGYYCLKCGHSTG